MSVLEDLLVVGGVLCVLGNEVHLMLGSWEDSGWARLLGWGWGGGDFHDVDGGSAALHVNVNVGDVEGEVVLDFWGGRHLENGCVL